MKTLPLHEEYVRAGADFGEEPPWIVPGHFGDPAGEYQAAVERAALFDLSNRTKVELAGPDSRVFLNNLCTNDIKDMPAGGGCEAFLLTATGKIVAHVLVGEYPERDTVLLRLDAVPDQAALIQGYLGHYLVSEQVELADRSEACGLFHVCGPEAAGVLRSVIGEDVSDLGPLHNRAVQASADRPWCQVRRHRAVGLDGYDLFLPVGGSLDLWKKLRDSGVTSAGRQTYDTLRIEAGVPEFAADFDAQRFVMEVGRSAQAIAPTKGCYLGQEAVVMARDRGQVNRALMGVGAPADGLLPEGGRLFKGKDEVGHITSSTESPRLGQVIALAYLRRGSQEPGTALTVEPDTDGRTVTVCALPFLQ